MNLKRIISFAIAFAVVSTVVHSIGAFAAMPYYLEEQYFPVWSEYMMPSNGPPGPEFTYLSIAFALISGFLLGYVFDIVKSSIPGKRKGVMYGFLIFLVSTVPSSLGYLLLINLPMALIGLWTVESFVILIASGVLAEKIIKI